METLENYIMEHAIRGACQCGRCIDAVAHPEQNQPTGHTADVVFFKVAARDADAAKFRALVADQFPHWLDGEQHSYMEMGADIGDQGLALTAMGMGEVLGVWTLITPAEFGLTGDAALAAAGRGLVTIMVDEDKESV